MSSQNSNITEEEYNDLNNKINNLKMIIDISNTNNNLQDISNNIYNITQTINDLKYILETINNLKQ